MRPQGLGIGGSPDRLFTHRLRIAGFWLALVALFVYVIAPIANATTSISRSYTAEAKIPLGSIVSIKENTADTVIPALTDNLDSLLGVVISNENSLLSVTSDAANQTQVATSGVADVLVSDMNGSVLRGDHITASPIAGVGMKATGNVKIIGIAQSDLEGNAVNQKYTDSSGVEQEVQLGQVPVMVNVAYYFKEPEKTIIPTALQNLANALAGKTVSPLPVLVSAGIFVVMLIVVVSIIYSMIRGSIISVGRNPMSQSAVYRGIIQLSALVLVILGVGFIAIYLVLTRVG